MQELFFVVAVLGIAVFWMKVVEALGLGLTPVLLFIEERLDRLEKWFSPPNPEKKDRPLQTGDFCLKCEEGFLQMELSPFHPSMVDDASKPAQWPYNLVCPYCHAVTVGEY